MADDGLTDQQRRFADEYLKDSNASRAARAAGYSPASAAVQGSRLLKHVKVALYVNSRRASAAGGEQQARPAPGPPGVPRAAPPRSAAPAPAQDAPAPPAVNADGPVDAEVHDPGDPASDPALMDGLTERQWKFVQAYLEFDGNGTKAAEKAGYSAAAAASQASRLLTYPAVQKALAQERIYRAAAARITAARTLAEISAVSFSNHRHFTVDDSGQLVARDDAPPNADAAISSVKHTIRSTTGPDGFTETTRTVEYKMWDKNAALLKGAARHLGLLPDRIEVTGKDGGPLQVADATRIMTSEEVRRELVALEAMARDRIAGLLPPESDPKAA